MTRSVDVAIIGGGAAGLMAACEILRLRPNLRVLILEKQDRVGRKLLATGNGRCNLSNLGATADRARVVYPGGGDYVKEALRLFPPDEVRRIFASMGLLSRPDENGRLYPVSNQAASVLDALRLTLAERGAKVIAGFDVKRILTGFRIIAASEAVEAPTVVLATGSPASPSLGASGCAHSLARPLGHRLKPWKSSLAPLLTDPARIKALTGLKYRGGISLYDGDRFVAREEGEILFGQRSLSGIAAMQLSRAAGALMEKGHRPQAVLRILTPEEAATLSARRQNLPTRALEDFLTGITSKRIGQVLMKECGVLPLSRPASSLRDRELEDLRELLTGWRLPILGTGDFSQAQVASGGLDLRDFDPCTMMSRILPGFYVIGEALDVDGICGGYNLHWAWASALSCARAIARIKV